MTEEERKAALADLMDGAEPAEEAPVEDMTTVTSLEGEPAIAEAAEQPRGKGRPRKVVSALAEAVAEIEAMELSEEAEERLHPLLSNEEVLAARAEARAALEADQRKAAKKKIVEDEKQRLRTEEGLVTGDGTKDQMVRISLDLAPHSPFIVLNHRPYYHAQTYVVPRHVAETLREIQQNGWRHQDEIDGKTLKEHYQRARDTGLSPVKGVTNAPARAA